MGCQDPLDAVEAKLGAIRDQNGTKLRLGFFGIFNLLCMFKCGFVCFGQTGDFSPKICFNPFLALVLVLVSWPRTKLCSRPSMWLGGYFNYEELVGSECGIGIITCQSETILGIC